jgi:hypothetical protein
MEHARFVLVLAKSPPQHHVAISFAGLASQNGAIANQNVLYAEHPKRKVNCFQYTTLIESNLLPFRNVRLSPTLTFLKHTLPKKTKNIDDGSPSLILTTHQAIEKHSITSL